jgi:hypothetical protein
MDASEGMAKVGATLLPGSVSMYSVWTVFTLLVGTSIAIAFHSPEPRPYLGLCLPIAAGFLMIPYAARFGHRRLLEWAANVSSFAVAASPAATTPGQGADQWVLSELNFFKGSPRMYGAGLCLTAWTLSAFYLGGYFSNLDTLQLAFFCVLVTLSASLAGAGLCAIFCATRMIWRLGDGRYRILVRDHKFGVLSTGRLLGETYFVVACICMVYDVSAVLGERNLYADFKYSNPPLWMLVVPTAVFIAATFICCQVPLHRQMVAFKKTELTRVETRLDQLKSDDEQRISSEQWTYIQFYEDRRKEILSLPEWPFGLKSVLGTVVSSITAGLPTLFSAIGKAVPGFHLGGDSIRSLLE